MKRAKIANIGDINAAIWTRTVALQIRTLREARKLTQAKFAKQVGLSRTSVVNIEQHAQAITLLNLYRMAKALGVHPRRLLPAR